MSKIFSLDSSVGINIIMADIYTHKVKISAMLFFLTCRLSPFVFSVFRVLF